MPDKIGLLLLIISNISCIVFLSLALFKEREKNTSKCSKPRTKTPEEEAYIKYCQETAKRNSEKYLNKV